MTASRIHGHLNENTGERLIPVENFKNVLFQAVRTYLDDVIETLHELWGDYVRVFRTVRTDTETAAFGIA